MPRPRKDERAERRETMRKKDRRTLPSDRLENTYQLKRVDGSRVGEWFYVLLESDPFAPAALAAYADACEATHPQLADDLRRAAALCGSGKLEEPRTTSPDTAATYWNGERCKALRVTVVVADDPDIPAYWARPLVGQRRKAVAVTYNGDTFYLDDEDGQAWAKVTIGRGSPVYGHRELSVSAILPAEAVAA
jgi:hypothetical protein